MAKLLSYYRLCPLIDIKSLLGVSEDVQKGNVIVTLGRNIAIKYRIADQKQLLSWRSKDKFSSPVLFDHKQEKYVAVFNQYFVRFWSEDDENLDKIKKYKFNDPIHTIFTHNKETFILFKCGALYPLNEILETRKTTTLDKIVENLEIEDVIHLSVNEDLYVGYRVKTDNDFTFYWSLFTQYYTNKFTKMRVHRSDAALNGHVFYVERNTVHLLSVWTDGKIFIKPLNEADIKSQDPGELFTIIETISSQHLVKVAVLSDHYIAIYGSDPNEEGAVLLVYNTQFKVTQSRQIHKLYSAEANIWQTFNYILFPVGQNLMVVPFCLESEQLASLVGSHKPLDNKIDSDIAFVTDFEVVSWQTTSEKGTIHNKSEVFREWNIPQTLKNKVDELFKQGQTEALILEQILPDVFEEKNVNLLAEILEFFTDIPEKFLAKMLKSVISYNKTLFGKHKGTMYHNLPTELLPAKRIYILDQILTRSYSDILLLPHLRAELSVEEALTFLKYMLHLLSEDGHNLPSLDAVQTEECVINWICLVIDSNYQKFVLSREENIEKVLVACKAVVTEHLDALESLKSVEPILSRFEQEVKGRTYGNGLLAKDLYSVDQIALY